MPKFATEAEGAKWWDDHKEMVEENPIQAIRDGTARRGTAQRLVREARASRKLTIRMAEADLDLARKQAAEKGLPYQTYIKSVLHTRARAAAFSSSSDVTNVNSWESSSSSSLRIKADAKCSYQLIPPDILKPTL